MSPNRGSRVVLYVRVSTGKQVAEGHSLDAQRSKLHAYAQERGLEVVECIADEGVSAGTLDRPGMSRLLALVDERAIDAIVVTKGDRVSRSLSDFVKLSERCEAHGVSLITTDEPFDDSTPLGKAMSQIRSVFSELERDMARARTRDGMAAAKVKGIHVGRPPLGWSSAKGKWFPNDRYPLVERAHGLKADGLRQADIADVFNAEGIPTGSGRGRWHASNVGRLLKSPLVSQVEAA